MQILLLFSWLHWNHRITVWIPVTHRQWLTFTFFTPLLKMLLSIFKTVGFRTCGITIVLYCLLWFRKWGHQTYSFCQVTFNYQSDTLLSRLKQGYTDVLVKSVINCESFPCQRCMCAEYFTAGHTHEHTLSGKHPHLHTLHWCSAVNIYRRFLAAR